MRRKKTGQLVAKDTVPLMVVSDKHAHGNCHEKKKTSKRMAAACSFIFVDVLSSTYFILGYPANYSRCPVPNMQITPIRFTHEKGIHCPWTEE